MALINPFTYQPKKNIFQRLPALLKLLIFLFFSISSLFVSGPILAIYILFFLILAIPLRLSPRHLFSGLPFLLVFLISLSFLALFSFKTYSFNFDGLEAQILYMGRIFAAFFSAKIYFASAGSSETELALRSAENAFFRPIEAVQRRFFPKKVRQNGPRFFISLPLSLLLSFIPQIFATWAPLDLALKARSRRLRPLLFFSALPLLFERLLLFAKNRERAMRIRAGYD